MQNRLHNYIHTQIQKNMLHVYVKYNPTCIHAYMHTRWYTCLCAYVLTRLYAYCIMPTVSASAARDATGYDQLCPAMSSYVQLCSSCPTMLVDFQVCATKSNYVLKCLVIFICVHRYPHMHSETLASHAWQHAAHAAVSNRNRNRKGTNRILEALHCCETSWIIHQAFCLRRK